MIRLFIDGREYQTDGGQSLSLSYNASALSDVQSARSASKVFIAVPSTPETDLLFGNADNPLTAERFNAANHSAAVEVDGVRLFEGKALLASVERRGKAVVYRLEIKSESALWAHLAVLRKLPTADVKFSGKLTPEDIEAGWSDNRPVKFFPVNRSDSSEKDSSTSLLPVQAVTTTDDYWPFISVEALVKALFEDSGYTVKSKFMEGDLFRSLYISGGCAASDALSRSRKMNFRAGRTTDATAAADYFGRVYMSASVPTNSVGNIVDTVDPYVTDADGRVVATGLFANNDCFYVDDAGIATFKPKGDTVVGFEFSLAFVTDHIIASRTELKGFNNFCFGDGTRIPFVLENRYEDQKAAPLPGYSYKFMVFDYDPAYTYRLTGNVDGLSTFLGEASAQMFSVTMPSAKNISNLRALRAPKNSTSFTVCPEDWALYWGYVGLRGQTEVDITLRTPAESVAGSSVKRFNEIFMEGAEQGMGFKLLKRTTVRPVFSSAKGYGSKLSFKDVAAVDVRQSDLLDALRQMFDLQFCTDQSSRTLFIEPYADFFSGEVVDWRDRVDRDLPIVLRDPSLEMHEEVTIGYADGDRAVDAFNNSKGEIFGRWSFIPDSQAVLNGEKTILNPLFAPTLNGTGKFAKAASASVPVIREGDEDSDDNVIANFSPRIVRYAGLRPLAAGETWGSGGSRYPLAAFHFAGDSRTEGFSLCFEDRDGIKGLHRFHEQRLKEESEGIIVSLSLRLEPWEAAALGRCIEGMPSVRSRFRLDIDGRTPEALYSLRSVEGYDPAKPSVRCTFIKIPQTL